LALGALRSGHEGETEKIVSRCRMTTLR
jgi:hypothetical protein